MEGFIALVLKYKEFGFHSFSHEMAASCHFSNSQQSLNLGGKDSSLGVWKGCQLIHLYPARGFDILFFWTSSINYDTQSFLFTERQRAKALIKPLGALPQ